MPTPREALMSGRWHPTVLEAMPLSVKRTHVERCFPRLQLAEDDEGVHMVLDRWGSGQWW